MSIDPVYARIAEDIGRQFAKEDYDNQFFANDNGDDAKTHLMNIVDYALNKHQDTEAPELARSFFHAIYMKMAIEQGRTGELEVGQGLTSPEVLKHAVTSYWNSALAYIKQDLALSEEQTLQPSL